MLQAVSPLFVGVAVFIGAVLTPILQWARAYLNNQTTLKIMIANKMPTAAVPPVQLDLMRVTASAVLGLIGGALFLTTYANIASVGLHELGIAFIAGFGVDTIIKNAIGI